MARSGVANAPAAPMPTPAVAMMEGAKKAEAREMMVVAQSADSAQPAEQSIRARIDFNALAFYAASLPTDTNGRASVKVKLPDSLTRYRGKVVGFCNTGCRDKFEAATAAFDGKIEGKE